jgi:hypothetical protein
MLGILGTHLIEKGQDTEFSLNQVDARLIIEKFNERPVDLLAHIFLLLQFKDMLVELEQLAP